MIKNAHFHEDYTETAQIIPRGPSLLSSSVSGCLLGKPQGGQTYFSLSGYLGVKLISGVMTCEGRNEASF